MVSAVIAAPIALTAETRPTRRTGTLPVVVAAVVVLVVGFLVRFALVARGGGLLGIGAYDDGVYYTAAAQFLHGHLPYRDYLFVQPPLIVLLLAPFAALAHLVGDPAAVVAMRVGFELIGGLNAALVLLTLRRFGFPAAIVGGLMYAVFYPAVYDERTALLEPIGTAGLLVALLILSRVDLPGSRALVGAGVALGLAIDMKIWFAVPLVVVLVFTRGGRLRVLLGATAAVVAVYLPFFLAAPVKSFTQIVLDQVGRGRSGSLAARAESILGVDGTGPFSTVPHVAPPLAAAVCALALAAAVVVAVRDPRARLFVALLLSGVLVLVAAPSYFEHYASLVAPPLTLVVGVAAGRLLGAVRRRALRIAALAVMLVLVCALNVRHDLRPVDHAVPVTALQSAARSVRGCIYADDPTVLAVMGVLTRDLDAGCAVQPDMSGISFDPAGRPPGVLRLDRTVDAVYQDEVLTYLRSGAAFLTVRPGAALSEATKRELRHNRILFADGPWVLRRGGVAG